MSLQSMFVLNDGESNKYFFETLGVGTVDDPFRIATGDLDYNALRRAEKDAQAQFGDVVSIRAKAKNLDKFGRTILQGTSRQMIMEFAGTEIEEAIPTTNAITHAITDDPDFTGTAVVEGHYLESGVLKFSRQEVICNGYTAVPLSQALRDATRIGQKRGAFGQLASDKSIYVYEGGATTDGVPNNSAEVHVLMNKGFGRSQKAVTAISYQDYWFITGIYAGALKKVSASVDVELRIRYLGDDWQTVKEIPTITTGNPFEYLPLLDCPIIVPPNTDVGLFATGSNGVEITGGMCGPLGLIVG